VAAALATAPAAPLPNIKAYQTIQTIYVIHIFLCFFGISIHNNLIDLPLLLPLLLPLQTANRHDIPNVSSNVLSRRTALHTLLPLLPP